MLALAQSNRMEYRGFTLGEGAIGSMIPPSIIIILFAIVRIIQLFQQRRNRQCDEAIQLEIRNRSDNDAIKLEITEECYHLSE